MAEMGVLDGSILKVDDFLQNYQLTVTVNHYVPAERSDPLYKIVSEGELKAKESKAFLNPCSILCYNNNNNVNFS